MISRPLARVRDGDVLGLGLVNQMIGRVEYAADLLRRGKGIAGDQISLQESAAGTSVNYSRSESQYRILADYFAEFPAQAIIFDSFANTVFNFPPLYDPIGIDGQDIVGTIYFGIQNSFYYNGIDYRTISHPQAERTYALKIRNKIACGYYEYPNPPGLDRYLGFKYNVQTNQYSNISWPAFQNTQSYAIYNNSLVGIAYDDFGVQVAWYFNGSSFQDITSIIGGVTPEPLDIYGDYIVGRTGISGRFSAFILNIKTNSVFYPQKFPNRDTLEFNGIYKNICVGTARNVSGDGPEIPVQYDISTNELSQIIAPTPIPIRRAFGIG